MTNKIDTSHYTAPAIAVGNIVSKGVLCESSSFGFKTTNGLVDGDLDGAGNGYGSIDNGSY